MEKADQRTVRTFVGACRYADENVRSVKKAESETQAFGQKAAEILYRT